MRIGCAVQPDLFEDGRVCVLDTAVLCGAFGGRAGVFDFLKNNVDALEISSIYPGKDPNILLNAVKKCHKYGLYATIHGYLADSVEDFFHPYTLLFQSGMQPVYNVTVHPFQYRADTEKMLRDICAYADERDYPIRITLENQRYSSEEREEQLCESVAWIVDRIQSDRLKVCLDFGHQLSGVRKYGEDRDPISEKFFSLVRQTHIHSLYDGVTHYPLTCGECMLEENLRALKKYGYDGILNLELGFQIYAGHFNVKETLFESIEILKQTSARIFSE